MILECRNLNKAFLNKKAVIDFNLRLQEGKIYGLLGENGSGKTTWMKMVAGLSKPSSGDIIFKGHTWNYHDKGEIAYMSTEPFFYDFMTVDSVGEYYEDFFEDFDRTKYQNLLQRVGLSESLKVRQLSSGMNSKLKIVATLARNASLYLLDEPLNGIDLKQGRKSYPLFWKKRWEKTALSSQLIFWMRLKVLSMKLFLSRVGTFFFKPIWKKSAAKMENPSGIFIWKLCRRLILWEKL